MKLLLHAVFKDGSRTRKVEVGYKVRMSGEDAHLIPKGGKLIAHRAGEVSHFVWEFPWVPGFKLNSKVRQREIVRKGEPFEPDYEDYAIKIIRLDA